MKYSDKPRSNKRVVKAWAILKNGFLLKITAYDRIFRQKKTPEEALTGSLLGV